MDEHHFSVALVVGDNLTARTRRLRRQATWFILQHNLTKFAGLGTVQIVALIKEDLQ